MKTLDPLWRAACWEQSALDAVRLGMYDAARGHVKRAGEVLEEALDGLKAPS